MSATAGDAGSDSTGGAAAGGGLSLGGISLSALLSSVFTSGAMVALGWVVFPPLNALNAITILSAFLNIPGGISVARGDSSMPFEYSKWGARPGKGRSVVHGRAGMLVMYTLGLAASLAGLGIFLPSDTPTLLRSDPKALFLAVLQTRPLLVAFLLWVHFTKRLVEVMVVHSYSGTMATQTAITISLAYGVSASLLQYQVAIIPASIYEQAVVRLVKLPLPPAWGLPPVPLPVAIGLALFALGQMGNGYHHALLAALRVLGDEELNKKVEGAAAADAIEGPATAAAKGEKGGATKRKSKAKPSAPTEGGPAGKGADATAAGATAGEDRITKQYKIPQGGLFPLVACPHYLFECVAWFGLAVVSQHVYALVMAAGMASYLLGRAYLTRQWYLKNLPGFPPERKCMIPFIF